MQKPFVVGPGGREATIVSKESSLSAWNVFSSKSWGYIGKTLMERLSAAVSVLRAHKWLQEGNTWTVCSPRWTWFLVWLLILPSLLFKELEALTGFGNWLKQPCRVQGSWERGSHWHKGRLIFEAGSKDMLPSSCIASGMPMLELWVHTTLASQRDVRYEVSWAICLWTFSIFPPTFNTTLIPRGCSGSGLSPADANMDWDWS